MEDPASWGEAERVIRAAYLEWSDGHERRVIGASLAKMIADALRQAGLLTGGGLWLRMREAADRWDDAEPGSQEQQLAAAGLVADFQSLDHLLRPGPLAEKAQEDDR